MPQDGRGSVLGTVLGLLIVSSLVRGLMMARVPMEDQKIILGIVLIVAAVVHQIGAAQARTKRSTTQPQAQVASSQQGE